MIYDATRVYKIKVVSVIVLIGKDVAALLHPIREKGALVAIVDLPDGEAVRAGRESVLVIILTGRGGGKLRQGHPHACALPVESGKDKVDDRLKEGVAQLLGLARARERGNTS